MGDQAVEYVSQEGCRFPSLAFSRLMCTKPWSEFDAFPGLTRKLDYTTYTGLI